MQDLSSKYAVNYAGCSTKMQQIGKMIFKCFSAVYVHLGINFNAKHILSTFSSKNLYLEFGKYYLFFFKNCVKN